MPVITYGALPVSNNAKIDPHNNNLLEVTYISLKPGPGYIVSIYFTGTERAACIQKRNVLPYLKIPKDGSDCRILVTPQ